MFRVNWTNKALKELSAIVVFWNEHNGSQKYSKKLHSEIKQAVKLLKQNPQIGVRTDLLNVRRYGILTNFSLFYSIEEQTVNILSVWDNRRNPDELNL